MKDIVAIQTGILDQNKWGKTLPKTKVKKKDRFSKKKQFLVRYSLTMEQLTFKGRKCSDTIIRKAWEFLDMGCIEHSHTEEIEFDEKTKMKRQVWICKPIPGYNSTTYTMHIDHYGDTSKIISCNCQYCRMQERMCSHLLALLCYNDMFPLNQNVKIVGGVRQKGKKVKNVEKDIDQLPGRGSISKHLNMN